MNKSGSIETYGYLNMNILQDQNVNRERAKSRWIQIKSYLADKCRTVSGIGSRDATPHQGMNNENSRKRNDENGDLNELWFIIVVVAVCNFV